MIVTKGTERKRESSHAWRPEPPARSELPNTSMTATASYYEEIQMGEKCESKQKKKNLVGGKYVLGSVGKEQTRW